MASAFVENKNNFLLKKYFIVWKNNVWYEESGEKTDRNQETEVNPIEKLDNLIKTIKQYQIEEKETVKNAEFKISKGIKINPNTLTHRYAAQQSIIKKLTEKLQAKNQVIDDLKLGILNKNALQAIENAKVEIREIFSNCSVRLRCKIPPPEDIGEKFMIASQKAPKFVQKMHERAVERAKNREVILERKRIIEERRKRELEEALEKKRVQDEEETKRNLEAIKEKRKKELEMERIRRENKMIYMEKLNKALLFENRKLLERSLRFLYVNVLENRKKKRKSADFYKKLVERRVMKKWQGFVEEKYEPKYKIADQMSRRKTLKKYFQYWLEMRVEAKRNWQVAEDFSDFCLQKNVFVFWFRYVCKEIVIMDRKVKLADKHHNKKIIFQYFYQWRSLPAVMQLEKTKEEKKRKWREKVWEILPNYKPPGDY